MAYNYTPGSNVPLQNQCASYSNIVNGQVINYLPIHRNLHQNPLASSLAQSSNGLHQDAVAAQFYPVYHDLLPRSHEQLSRGHSYSTQEQITYDHDTGSQPLPSSPRTNEKTHFSKLLQVMRDRKIDFQNNYDQNNKMYQILANSFRGSLYLIAYQRDMAEGLLQSSLTDNDSNKDTDLVGEDAEVPALPPDELMLQYSGKDKKGRKLTSYFNPNDVARILVESELDRTGEKITPQTLDQLGIAAADLFPGTGPKDLWYQMSCTVNGTSVTARGKLNIQYKLLSSKVKALDVFEDEFTKNNPSDMKKKWLQCHIDLKEFFKRTLLLSTILLTIPILKTMDGLKLLTEQFDLAHSETSKHFVFRWYDETQLILKKAVQLQKPEIDKLLQYLDKLNTKGEQLALALVILPLMMKPTKCFQISAQSTLSAKSRSSSRGRGRGRARGRGYKQGALNDITNISEPENVLQEGVNWTASTLEMQDSFVKYIEINITNENEENISGLEEIEIMTHREKLLQLYSNYKMAFKQASRNTSQKDIELTTHIIIVGPLDAIRKCILFIDDARYEFVGPNSVLKAVQSCFKAMLLLRKNFPIAASAVWEYIKYSVYSMPVPGALTTTKAFHTMLSTKKMLRQHHEKKATATHRK